MKTLNLSFTQIAFILACSYTASAFSADETAATTMSLTSSAFSHQGAIPKQFTCDGSDVSPELTWSNVPTGSKSLVLIVDDPDTPAPIAPVMTWVHWVLYNIPATASKLFSNIGPENLPKGTLQGKNDWKQPGYKGPCPTFGSHRYFFKLYALDTELPDLDLPDKAALMKAMDAHILGHAELIGTYKR
ncbi:MAG: YbhB/YbcL family Raf kinase inhibitor-like protein [Methylomicrobium sp.]